MCVCARGTLFENILLKNVMLISQCRHPLSFLISPNSFITILYFVALHFMKNEAYIYIYICFAKRAVYPSHI